MGANPSSIPRQNLNALSHVVPKYSNSAFAFVSVLCTCWLWKISNSCFASKNTGENTKLVLLSPKRNFFSDWLLLLLSTLIMIGRWQWKNLYFVGPKRNLMSRSWTNWHLSVRASKKSNLSLYLLSSKGWSVSGIKINKLLSQFQYQIRLICIPTLFSHAFYIRNPIFFWLCPLCHPINHWISRFQSPVLYSDGSEAFLHIWYWLSDTIFRISFLPKKNHSVPALTDTKLNRYRYISKSRHKSHTRTFLILTFQICEHVTSGQFIYVNSVMTATYDPLWSKITNSCSEIKKTVLIYRF